MEIETARLRLREFTLDDWPEILAYQSDPRYQYYYPATNRTPEKVRAFVQMFIDQQQEQPRVKFQLAATLKEERTLIGNCGIRMNKAHGHKADLGYEFSPEYWGRGYATEAAQAMLEFGFTELNLHRIWARCVADNLASARVLEKLGLKLEGRLQEHEHFKNRWWDTLIYGLLASDWKAQS